MIFIGWIFISLPPLSYEKNNTIFLSLLESEEFVEIKNILKTH